MALSTQQIEEEAHRLLNGQLASRFVEPVRSQFPDLSLDEAYAIQRSGVELWQEEGRRVIGYKAGLTSDRTQQMFGLNHPVYGVLLDSTRYESGNDIEVRLSSGLKVEMELVFVMAKDIQGKNLTIQDVIQATDYVVPALELIEPRFQPDAEVKSNVLDLVADNVAAYGMVLGQSRIDPQTVDLSRISAFCTINGAAVATGDSSEVMRNPANTLIWLLNQGICLKKGAMILSGSFIPPHPCARLDAISGDFGEFGTVDCNLV